MSLSNIWDESKRLAENETAEVQGIIIMIVAVVVGAILTGALGGTAIDQVVAATNNSWSAGLLNTFSAVPILYAVAFLLVPIVVILKYIG